MNLGDDIKALHDQIAVLTAQCDQQEAFLRALREDGSYDAFRLDLEQEKLEGCRRGLAVIKKHVPINPHI